MPMRHTVILLPALLLSASFLAACGEKDTDPGPGGVTVAEARALDEAAEMIESRKLPQDALEPAADQIAPVAAESAPAVESTAAPQPAAQ